MKKYRVTLTDEERRQLQAMIAAGKAAAKTLAHARILLKADQADGGPAWPDHRIAEALEVSVATVERVRQRLVEHGLDAALRRKDQDRPSRLPVLDGRAEARLIALACSAPPKGRKAWTLRLLADRLVELEVVEAVAPETVRHRSSSRAHRRADDAIPSRADPKTPDRRGPPSGTSTDRRRFWPNVGPGRVHE